MPTKTQPDNLAPRVGGAVSSRKVVPPTIRELMVVDKAARDTTWLMDALQNAIALEFSTIPPYLCAWWSIKDNQDDVARSIRTILFEEMRHMGLACNLLAGIGGEPNLLLALPYPGPLPGDVHPGLVAQLQGLSYDAVRLFMEIELPEFGPLAKARTAGVSYPTIGEFYNAVLDAFRANAENLAFDPNRQLMTSPRIFKITDLATAEEAINQIKREGEGSEESPADTGTGRDDLAHYYRFGEIFYGKQLAQDPVTKEWRFNGPDVPFPDVWPMARTPENGYQQNEVSDAVWQLLVECDQRFTDMLHHLQAAWNPQNPSADEMRLAVQKMRSLSGPTGPAVQLMQIELPTRNGTYGPCFRLLSTRKVRPIANRPTSFALHIRPLFTANDIEQMNAQGLNLENYDDVKSSSDTILDRLQQPLDSRFLMPPLPAGGGTGPWPDEWIALFKRWMDEDFPT